MHPNKNWKLWLAVALTAAGLASAIEAGSPPAKTAGFVVDPEQAAQLTGGEPLNVFADTLVREVVTTISHELLGNDAPANPSIGVWRYALPPYSGPTTRAHRDADQFLYVVAGRVEFVIGELKWLASAGSLAFIPRQTPHNFTNMADESAILIGGVLPEGSARYFAVRE